MGKPYTDEQFQEFTAKIVDHLRRAGPTAQVDLPHLIPGLSDYMLRQCISPLLRNGTVRRRSYRREHQKRLAYTSRTVTVTTEATFYELVERTRK
jgi:DNA-binding HxlR family transcriptional regulator